MARLRPSLTARGIVDARTLNVMGTARRITYVGMVICRQRPQTASGVTFMTLEDETGLVNLVIWKRVYDRDRLIAKTARLMEVVGEMQNEQGVVHLIADRLRDPKLPDKLIPPRSRDFH